MFPQVEATATSTTTSSLTTHTIDTPAGVVSGDLLIAFIGLENLTRTGLAQFSAWSDGFIEIKDKTTGGTAGASVGVAYKFSDGTEGANISVDSVDAERAAHCMYRISSASLASAPEITAGASASSSAPDPDNLVPVLLTRDYLWMALAAYNKIAATITGFPTNYGSNQVNIGQFSGATVGVATRELAAAAENPGVFTMDASEIWQAFTLAVTPLGTALLGGTAVAGVGTPIDEFDVVAGGKTLHITLTDEGWVNAGAAFDAIRQDIIDGITSAQAELLGWNNEVRDKMSVTDVVRFNGSLVIVTLPASAAYLLTADETITVTVPASSNLGGQTIVASNTFDVKFVPQGVVPSGDLVPEDFEQEIRNGGRTLLLTVNKDTWVAVGPTFDGIRQDIIDGLTSAQAEALGWNAEVRDKMPVTDVVRTSDTLVTITLSAQAAYEITADETITATVPASAVVTGGPYVATPTFDIEVDPTATISGTVFPSGTLVEEEVIAGGKTIIITLVGDTWVPSGMEFDGIRQDIIDELTSDIFGGVEPNGWNQDVRDNLPPGQCVRTSDTVVTITLVAVPTYATSVVETITVTVPPIALVKAESDVVGTPTFTVDPTGITVSGSAVPSSLELQIVNGGQTIILTLLGDTWVAAGPTFDGTRQEIIDGITSAQVEATGWNAEVRDKMPLTDVVRTSGTVITITLSAQAGYNISAPEEITVSVPAAAMVLTGTVLVAAPTFNVNQIPTAIVGGTIAFSSTENQIRAGGRTILLFLTDDTWVATGGAFEAERQGIIDGLVSAQSEVAGWNAEIVPNIPVGAVERTSDTLVTITLIPRNQYDIDLLEQITVTIPGTALVVGVGDLIALPDPGFQITPVTTKGHARDRRGGAHAETGVDVNEPDANTYDVNTF